MSDERPIIKDDRKIGEVIDFVVDPEGVELTYKLDKGICHNCLQPIKVAIFRGGDYCSDQCRKALGKDIK